MKKLKQFFENYVKSNYKEYILVTLLFIIGIFIGVMIINNCEENQISEVREYITNFINKLKQTEDINKLEILGISIKNNLIIAFILWLAGTTIIGVPIVLAILLWRGIILGYTISSIAITIGTVKGIIFCLISIFLHNLLFIPALLTLGVSGIRLYKTIIKDRQIENIKFEIIKHTCISIIIVIVLIGTSFIENFVSIMILKKYIKYF